MQLSRICAVSPFWPSHRGKCSHRAAIIGERCDGPASCSAVETLAVFVLKSRTYRSELVGGFFYQGAESRAIYTQFTSTLKLTDSRSSSASFKQKRPLSRLLICLTGSLRTPWRFDKASTARSQEVAVIERPQDFQHHAKHPIRFG